MCVSAHSAQVCAARLHSRPSARLPCGDRQGSPCASRPSARLPCGDRQGSPCAAQQTSLGALVLWRPCSKLAALSSCGTAPNCSENLDLLSIARTRTRPPRSNTIRKTGQFQAMGGVPAALSPSTSRCQTSLPRSAKCGTSTSVAASRSLCIFYPH